MESLHYRTGSQLGLTKVRQRVARPRRCRFGAGQSYVRSRVPLLPWGEIRDRFFELRAVELVGAGLRRLDSIGASGRLSFLGACFTLMASLIAIRVCTLQTTEFEKWSKFASRQHDTSVMVQGARGNIYDRSGRSLAVSVRSVALGVHPEQLRERPDAAARLAELSGKPLSYIEEKLRETKPFVWIARGLPVSTEESFKPSESQGIQLVPEFRRYYPQGAILGPVLGRVGRDGEGLSGLERQFDATLRGRALRVSVRRDARGRLLNAIKVDAEEADPMRLLERVRSGEIFSRLVQPLTGETAPEETVIRNEGDTVQLSIDAVIQGIVEEELNRGEQDGKAARVFGLVLDAENGELLALAQSSSFNPNVLDEITPRELKSAVLQDNFEPGSTLKPLVTAAALDAGVLNAGEMLDCENGSYRIGRHTIRDVHPQKVLSVGEVLVRSSNICMAKIGQRLGKERLYGALRNLGFGAPSGIELQGEAGGILRHQSKWSQVDEATHAFGQGISVTALQMAQAYGALANGGLLIHPTIIKRNGEPVPSTRVFSRAHAAAVAEMLRGVTEGEHGTGRQAAIQGLTVFGKTGTAQKARVNGKGYDPDKILASFIGFVDGESIGVKRKLVMYVAVDEPAVRPRWGGTLAAPVFRRAMSRILSHLLTVDPEEFDHTVPLQTAALAHSRAVS